MRIFNEADFTKRSWAYFIDMLLVSLPVGIIFAPEDLSPENIPDFSEAIPVIALIHLLYFFLCTYFNRGQTLGQMILKIKVISVENIEGRPKNIDKLNPGLINSFLHSLGKILLIIIFDLAIGYILYGKEEDMQKPTRFLQNLGRTKVIEQPSKIKKN